MLCHLDNRHTISISSFSSSPLSPCILSISLHFKPLFVVVTFCFCHSNNEQKTLQKKNQIDYFLCCFSLFNALAHSCSQFNFTLLFVLVSAASMHRQILNIFSLIFNSLVISIYALVIVDSRTGQFGRPFKMKSLFKQ